MNRTPVDRHVRVVPFYRRAMHAREVSHHWPEPRRARRRPEVAVGPGTTRITSELEALAALVKDVRPTAQESPPQGEKSTHMRQSAL
jgi:hypothetical protein